MRGRRRTGAGHTARSPPQTCLIGAAVSAFASTTGILAALIPLAVPFLLAGEIGAIGVIIALALSSFIVNSSPFSKSGALCVANALDDQRDYVWARARRCVRPAGLGPLGEVRRAHRSDARQLPVDELGVRAGCTAGTGPHARPAAARPAADGEQAYAAGAGRRCPTGRPRDAGVASQDLQEGVRAFTAKRSPAWQGR